MNTKPYFTILFLFLLFHWSSSIALRQYFEAKVCQGDPFLVEINPYWSCPSQPFCNTTSQGFADSTSQSCITRVTDFVPPRTSNYLVTAFYVQTASCSGTPTAVNYIMLDTCLKNQKDPSHYFKATCNANGTVTTHFCSEGCVACNSSIPIPSYCTPNIGGTITSCKPHMFLKQLKLQGI